MSREVSPPGPGHIGLVRRQFGANADRYATSHVHAQGASLRRLVELARPRPGWQALDVATGAGHTAVAVASHVARVIATDVTPQMLALADQLARDREATNVTVQHADAESLPFAAGTFDLVTCRNAAHHFPRVERFAAESHRVLKRGGLLALVHNVSPDDREAAAEADAIERLRDPSHVHCLSVAEWRDVLETAGFAIEHEELMDMPLELTAWAQRMNVSETGCEELRRRVLNASAPLSAFWRPQQAGDELRFVFTELLLVARRR